MGTTTEKLQRILQTKNEQRDFLKSVGEVTNETLFKDYLPAFMRLVSNVFNISIPVTQPKINYSTLENPPASIAVLYGAGQTQTNLFGVANVATTLSKTDTSPYLVAIPSIDGSFVDNSAESSESQVHLTSLVVGDYYSLIVEYETDLELQEIEENAMEVNGVAFNSLSSHFESGKTAYLFQCPNTISSDDILGCRFYAVNEADSGDITIKSMCLIHLGSELSSLSASSVVTAYPFYFSNTTHSKYRVLHKSNNVVTIPDGVTESGNVCRISLLPCGVQGGKAVSIQAWLKNHYENTTARIRINYSLDGGSHWVAIGANWQYFVAANGEGLCKIENIPLPEIMTHLYFEILPNNFDQPNTIEYSNLQVEYSTTCSPYAPKFDDIDLGTYELTGDEAINDIARYCWFEPKKGGYLLIENLDDYLLPKLDGSELNYYVEMSKSEIAQTLSTLETKNQEV